MADKRLNEGVSLFNKGEKNMHSLETTISKAKIILKKELPKWKEQKQGIVTLDVSQRFHLASLKHRGDYKN